METRRSARRRPNAPWKWRSKVKLCFMATVLFVAAPAFARADELSCISTTFNFLSPNDKVCVADFDDPKVAGVTCHSRRPGKADGVSRLVSMKIRRISRLLAVKPAP